MQHRFILFDRKITECFRGWGSESLWLWKWVAAKGIWIFFGIWMIIVVQGWMLWWRPLLPFVCGYITLLLVQAIIKRQRPNFEKISGYSMLVRTYSFPSGHATASTLCAITLATYPVFPTVWIAMGTAACLALLALAIMYSRIAVGVHYVTDVLAGLCLGISYAVAFM